MRQFISLCLLLAMTASLGACACRPGYVGAYGIRPARCVVW